MSSVIRVGDQVEYKRPGTRGTYRCLVRAMRKVYTHRYVVEIKAHCWSGTRSPAVGQVVTITHKHILRVLTEQEVAQWAK